MWRKEQSKTTSPFKKKSRRQPETLPIEQDVSKKELELPQQLWTLCKRETLVLALRLKGAKPLILRLPRDFVCLSCQEIQSQRPHPVASLEATIPNWQNIKQNESSDRQLEIQVLCGPLVRVVT